MTDREFDIQMALSVVGKTNGYFKDIWLQFGSVYGWDGAPCSEIACCISYMAGNISKIPVSNYAYGLVEKFRAAGMFGKECALGAFIFFDYGDGNGPSHTGRVVDIKDGRVYTVEGNIGGMVVERNYALNHPYIYGYGWPNYDVEPKPEPEPEPVKPTFSDVTEDMSSFRAIEWCADQGIIRGYKDGTFKPKQPLTREQACVMLWRQAGRP